MAYEGYGPAGVGRVLSKRLTDNRNRTAADVRSAFSHAGWQPGRNRLGRRPCSTARASSPFPKEVETGDKKNPAAPNGAAADADEFDDGRWRRPARDDYEDADDEWIVYTEPR